MGSLLSADDRAALATAVEQAARESGIENIRFFTQKNLYARRIVDRMGLPTLRPIAVDDLMTPELAAVRARGTLSR